MKRITERSKSGDMLTVKCRNCEKTEIGSCEDCQNAIYHRLTDIEDILGDNYDLDRLRELVEADRDGRCEIHKMKDGEVAYSIFAYVNNLHYRKPNGKPIDPIATYIVNDFTRNTVDREFGKTVFRTREAAAEALRQNNE